MQRTVAIPTALAGPIGRLTPLFDRLRPLLPTVAVGVAVVFALAITPWRLAPEWSVDGEHNLERARALLAGAPTLVDGWYFYTPLAAWATVPATLVPEPLALWGWAIAKVALLLAALALAFPDWRRLVVAAAFIPLIGDTAIGNVNAVIALGMVLAMRGGAWAGIPLGIALALFPKPVVVPFLLWLLWHHRRAGVEALATGGMLTLAGIVFLGVERYVDYARSLLTAGQFVGEAWNQAAPVVTVGLAVLFVVTLRDARKGLASALALGVAASPYVGVYTGTVLLVGPWGPVALALMSLGSLSFLPWVAAAAAVWTAVRPGAMPWERDRAASPVAAQANPSGPRLS